MHLKGVNLALNIHLSASLYRVAILCGLSLPAITAQMPHPISPADQKHIDALIEHMTLDQKLDYLGGTGMATEAIPSLGIPAFQMSDGPFGVRSGTGFPSTTYAAGISLAASWDTELAERVGAGIGRDARARGVHFMLGPGVNIYRSPNNGRNFEYFGEDPFLASAITVGYIDGMQAQGVSATVKHYLGNNSEFLRHDVNTLMDERTAHEIYLPAFEAAVKSAQVGAVMDSYNLINGVHATENAPFNKDVLRGQWGFEGVLMSDWDATYNAERAANGGLDLEMPTGKFLNRTLLQKAMNSGTVSQKTIDDKVRHILTTATSFDWLNRPQMDSTISYLDVRNQGAALDSAREGPVLLKNDNALLPLDKTRLKTILIVGPDAYPGVPVGGGSAGVTPFHNISSLEAISAEVAGKVNVLYDRGLPTMAELAEATPLMTTQAGGEAGVELQTFTNPTLAGEPAMTIRTQHLHLSDLNLSTIATDADHAKALLLAAGTPASHRFTGFYSVPVSGKYIAVLEDSGEGSGNRVFVDGIQIIDNWTLLRAYQPHVTLELKAGVHKIVVEDWQRGPLGGHLLFAITAADKIVSSKALELAARAEVVLIEAGFHQDAPSLSECEGGDRTFALPFGQSELIRAIASANKRTIVAITSGGNVDSTPWLASVPALLETWYGGQEGGRALAEILFGEVNPSGHLPITLERDARDNPTYSTYYPSGDTHDVAYKEGVFVGYRGYEQNHTEPLFPFGFGLSYTTFQFSNLRLEQPATESDLLASVSFDIKNTGNREGADVAQLYVTEDHPVVARPKHELKGFKRVSLAPGETRRVTLTLDRRAFCYYSVASHQWEIGSERFTIRVGDSLASLPLQTRMELKRTTPSASRAR